MPVWSHIDLKMAAWNSAKFSQVCLITDEQFFICTDEKQLKQNLTQTNKSERMKAEHWKNNF